MEGIKRQNSRIKRNGMVMVDTVYIYVYIYIALTLKTGRRIGGSTWHWSMN